MVMPAKKRVTPELVKQIADTIGLDVDERRAAELAPRVQALRDTLDAMDEVDITDVEPPTVFHLRQA